MINDSEQLLADTLNGNEDAVAKGFEMLHQRETAPAFYNNEQALRALIHTAYLSAVDDYVKIQELPTGKGYADIAFIPRKGSDKPAMIVELKYDKSAEGALAQIREKNYPETLAGLSARILLVGINYDSKSKKHECRIEEIKGFGNCQ